MVSKAKDFVEAMQKSKKVDVTLLNDEDSPCVVSEFISTGSLVLDGIMGGGLPVGRIVEIYGSFSSGKSLIGTQVAAVAQEQDYTVAYIDTESAVSISMMENLGVKTDELLYSSPDTIEDVFKFMDEAMETKHKLDPEGVLVLIWDSIAATTSEAESEKEYGQIGYTNQARIMSQALRKITKKFSKERVAVLFLNQIREKLGVMYGDKTATFGGHAVEFHASVRVHLTTTSKLKAPGKKKAKVIGMMTHAVVTKNKVAMPFLEADLPIYFGRAIDDEQASLLWLADNGYVTGEAWKTIELGGESIRFQKAGWTTIFEEHYDEIANIILSANSDVANDDGYGEIEEE